MDRTDPEDSERVNRTHDTWSRSRWNWGSFSFERAKASYEAAAAFGFLFVFLVTPVDTILWGVQWRAFRIDLPLRLSWQAVALIVALNGFFNAFTLHTLYLQKNPQEYRVRSGIRILRGLLGAFPAFGPLTLFLWRRMLKSHPQWILVPKTDGPALVVARPAPVKIRKRPASGASFRRGFIAICVSNGLCLAALMQWTSGFSPASGTWRLLACSLALHLIAFLSILAFLEDQTAPGPDARRRKLVSALLWLPPVPYLPLIGLFVLGWATAETRRSRTLTNQAFSWREGADRLTAWRAELKPSKRFRPKIFPRRRSEETAVASQARSRILALCDAKSFALALDAAAVSWFLVFSTRSSRLTAFFARGLLGVVLLAASALALAGLASWITAIARRWAGRPLSSWRSKALPRSLVLISVFLILGTLQGLLWNTIKLPDSNRPLLLVVSLYLSFKALTLIRFLLPYGVTSDESLADHLLRLLCMVGVWIGQIVISVSAHAGSTDLVLRFWAVYFFFGELLPGLIRLPWLLRPYQIRDLMSPFLPFSRKAVLAFLVLTGLVPFGGLAAPFWILWRHRLELETARIDQPAP